MSRPLIVLLAINFCWHVRALYDINSSEQLYYASPLVYAQLALSLYGFTTNNFFVLLILCLSWLGSSSYVMGGVFSALFVLSLCDSSGEESSVNRLNVDGMLTRETLGGPPFKYEFRRSQSVTGPADETKNNQVDLISFIPAIPYEETQFWRNKLNDDVTRLLISNGQVVYEITNLAGPAVSFDIYQMFDRQSLCPLSNYDVLTAKEVEQGWDPINTSLSDKFSFDERLGKARLKPGESFAINSPHRNQQVTCEVLKQRSGIPCYLAIFRGASSETNIKVTLKNDVEFSSSCSYEC